MVLTQGDAELRVVETRSDEEVSSAVTLTVTLNPDNFPDAAQGLCACLGQGEGVGGGVSGRGRMVMCLWQGKG